MPELALPGQATRLSRPTGREDANLNCRMTRRNSTHNLIMKNNKSILIRGSIGAIAVAFISGAYAQGGYGDGTRIMQRPTPAPSGSAAAATTKAPAKGGALSSQDSQFVSEAAKGGMMEVAGGKVASKNAKDADVKQFGNRMAIDHSKANNELKAIATKKGLKLPGGAGAPKWSGDKAYMDMMVQDHTNDLAEFKTEASKGSDPDLKAFASRGEKMVAEHLKMAKQIDGKLK
jgi:putative membrane protein